MDHNKPDIEADKEPVGPADRGESTGLMEPLVLSESARRRGEIGDLALDLATRSTGLRRSLPPGIVTALADLVRAMNCYYSNLIEGHDTHPVDIERALRGDYSADPEKRNLQLEAEAHIAVQRWIDEGGLDGRALTGEGIRDVHARFCERLPEALLWVVDPDGRNKAPVVPGELRTRDIQVGRHVAVSPGAVPRFLERFEQAHRMLGRTDKILAAASAHHRLLWIHPFMDGNGRVARLMSYAVLREALDTGGLWSVARGLARNEADYKRHLAACDMPRRNDLDGRGHLSEDALADFTDFFLRVGLDQVDFMESLMQPERLRDRIGLWAEEEIRAGTLPAHADTILYAVLYRGELARAEVPRILGTGARQARRVTAALTEHGVLSAETSRAPLRIAFPAKLAHRWMPGLFPEKRD